MKRKDDNGLGQLKDPELSKRCYHTPDDYFERLSGRIMSQIPKAHDAYVAPPASLWQQVRPALYLAASFLMIYLGLEITQLLTSERVDMPKVITTDIGEIEAPSTISDAEYALFYQDYSQRIVSKDDELALSGLESNQTRKAEL